MERKRSLPLWMFGVTAADKGGSKKQDECITIEEDRKLGPVESGSVVAEKDLMSSHDSVEDVNRNATLHTVRRTRNSNRRALENESAAGGNNDTSERNKKRKTKEMRKDENVEILKKKSKLNEFDGLEDSEILPSSQAADHVIELTVDDLVSIAKEYVKAEDKDCRTESVTGTTSKNLSSQLAPCRHERTSQAIDIAMDSAMKNSMGNNTLPASDFGSIATVGSDDAVKDLLNIFLGPVFSNLQKEDRKLEVGEHIPQRHESSESL